MGASLSPIPANDHLQTAFLDALSRILKVARFRFRHVRCCDTREDAICETVALCWVWYLALVRKGRNPGKFITALAHYGARAVHSGRRACGQERANDVLSSRCQRKQHFRVAPLPQENGLDSTLFEEALCDNTQTPIPDQVQFRCDFAAWQHRLPHVKQRLVNGLALSHRTKELAAKFGVSEGRISQLRREFFAGYTAFCGDSTGCE